MAEPNAGRTAGYQTWTDLLFLHWKADPAAVQRLLPCGLTVEVRNGDAWIGLVPFRMKAVRPWWSPPIPGISWFLETNVRTYVRHESGTSGVWFFSLDCSQRLAVAVARRFWHLNYIHADLSVSGRCPEQIDYAGFRPDDPDVAFRLSVDLSGADSPITASPGSLEHFLLERYLLFSRFSDGTFHTGRVHHAPYTYRPVRLQSVRQTLLAANGIDVAAADPPDHVVWSPGVHVRVSRLQQLSTEHGRQ